jgi:hypothetical protein
MTQLVDFHIQPSGRIYVVMGKKHVGVIEEHPVALRSTTLGSIGAYYQSYMPDDGAPSSRRPATSVKEARRRILQWLAGWFDAAGFQQVAEDLQKQAIDEREAV